MNRVTRGFGTRCIHAGEAPDPVTGAHGVPLYQNVTYAFTTHAQVEAMRSGERPHFTYSPRANPTVRCLELKIADLEGAETSVALASGMAAISNTLLAFAEHGGHIVASNQIYDLSRGFLRDELPALGASATFVDISDVAAVEEAITPRTRAIYAEPFSNPILAVADLESLSALARRRGVVLIIDNTFLSPSLLRPLEWGADIVIHSATKYLSGNGQVQGGVISGPRRLLDSIRERALKLGTAMPPFAAWLLLSGIHTLPLRMARHGQNAHCLATLLESHPAVAGVNYPGLVSHRGHQIASHLVGGDAGNYGGMLSFTLHGGSSAVRSMIDGLTLCTIAVSLGDSSTLVWPWHSGDLIRVSAGLEDSRDLEADFQSSLDAL